MTLGSYQNQRHLIFMKGGTLTITITVGLDKLVIKIPIPKFQIQQNLYYTIIDTGYAVLMFSTIITSQINGNPVN